MKAIPHKNILKYVTDFKEKGAWYIVTEYCGKGDLDSYCKKYGNLPEIFCINFAYGMICALSQLHEKNIAHRDLKLANVLINDNYDFKLSDFGLSRDNQFMESYCGSPFAMAPEILLRKKYDVKCDVWSLGIMLYQILFKQLPYNISKFGKGILALKKAIELTEPNFNNLPVKASSECIAFIKKCLEKDPAKRATAKELARHPWLQMGSNSLERRNFMSDTMEGKKLIKKVECILGSGAKEHLTKLFASFKLSVREISDNLSLASEYVMKKANLPQLLLAMVDRTIAEIEGTSVIISVADANL
jgi:serine/threonine protein kinase